MDAPQITLVSPKLTNTEPVAFGAIFASKVIGRSSSHARPSGLENEVMTGYHKDKPHCEQGVCVLKPDQWLNFSTRVTLILRNMHVFKAISAFSALAFASLAFASGLEWENTVFEATAEFGQEEVFASFKFTNTSGQEISITSTKASCGCTVANLEKKTYAPGEKGEVSAVFEAKSRVGKQQQYIEVFLNNEPESSDKLTIKVDIPQAVTLKPRIRIWRKGQEVSPQTFEVTLHQELDLEIDTLVPINEDADQFDYEIQQTNNSPRTYLISVTPKSVESPARGRFYLGSSNSETSILKKHPIYTFVR